MLSLCYEQNSSNCLSECGLSVYYNFNVFSNAVDFIALTPLMIRAGIQDGGLWIQCTVYVVKNILNFTKVILVLIKSKNSFSYIKGHAVHLKDISNRIGIIHQISFDKCRCSSISGYRNVLISLTLELFTSVTRTRQYLI